MEITKNGLTYWPLIGHFYRKSAKTEVGTLVKGALYIRYKDRRVPAHRVAWEMVHGPLPEGFLVTHIDGNKLNLKISNLKIMTREDIHKAAKLESDEIKKKFAQLKKS